MKLCKLLLAMSVLAAFVGVSWGGNPPERQWIKEETKDKWGDVSGYGYMQLSTVEGSTEKSGTGTWKLMLAYPGDDKAAIMIEPILSRVPSFVFIVGELGGNIGARISLRDEQKNTKEFYGQYMRLDASANLYLRCDDPDFVRTLQTNTKFTILITVGTVQQSWSVRGNIVGGLPYFKSNETVEREKKEVEDKEKQERVNAERAEREEEERLKFINSRKQITDARDGKKYFTVKIGEKTWMTENLNYQSSGGSWCYDNDNSNCDKYGRLYDWNTAKTACPAGWHLSSNEEWDSLVNFTGGKEMAGKKLKSTSGWGDNRNGTDDYGFSVLPGGSRSPDGSFEDVGKHGYWWTATECWSPRVCYRGTKNYDNYNTYGYVMGKNDTHKDRGFSVRCVEDSPKEIEEAKMAKKIAEEAKMMAEKAKRDEEQRIEKLSSYFTDSRNGQKYRSVKIGNKTWMAENLNYQPTKGNSWCYDNDNAKCGKYGRLYDWDAARKACPAGWRLPTDKEWDYLVDMALASGDTDGKKLKATSGWDKNGNGTDEFGFSALPGGDVYTRQLYFTGGGTYGVWWSNWFNWGCVGHVNSKAGKINEPDKFNYIGRSVRCVQK